MIRIITKDEEPNSGRHHPIITKNSMTEIPQSEFLRGCFGGWNIGYLESFWNFGFGYWDFGMKDLIKKLLHIEDTPERTAFAFSVGIFLGFSPFLGFHTLTGLLIAFLFKLNRVAILLGVWTNGPWWLIPYYTLGTWLGMWLIRFRIDRSTVKGIFQLGVDQGFMSSHFWDRISSQWGLLLSFMVGSLILALLLGSAAYPLALKWIKFYRSRRK
jgi:uncharacterized protein (DUF2062 family)